MVLIAVLGLGACSVVPVPQTASPAPVKEKEPASATASNLPLVRTATPTSPSQAVIDPALPTLELSPTPEPVSVILPLPPSNRAHYQLDATLDYNRHALAVEETISYTNTTTDRLPSIVLVVEAQRYPGTFQLVRLAGQDGKRISQFRLKDTILTVSLPQPLNPGATTRLSLSYTLQLLDVLKLPHVRPYPLGYSTFQADFGDWYPFIPPYSLGSGWLVHSPAFYGENLVYEVADFDVAIRSKGNQTNLVIAASAPATIDGEWRRFQHDAARSFAWSVSPYYQVMTETVQTTPGRSAIVASYYFSLHAEAGKSLLDTMAKALSLYSKLFGAYPHPMLSGIQVEFLDGMEYDGLYFLSRDFYNWHKDTQADFLVALAAHETAHQWWLGLVGSDQAQQPWLDEALCTYSERIYYENYSPDVLDWWWAYRVNYYEPKGWVDTSIYDVPNVVGQYRAYRDPVYLGGAQFLEELRGVMGDGAFFEALRAYVERYAYRQADAAGFVEIFREHTTQDLEPLLQKYFSKLK